MLPSIAWRISSSVGFRVPREQVGGGHDHARRAEAALETVVVPERLLQRMELRRPVAIPSIVVIVRAVRLDGEHRAALHGPPIDVDGARAALAGVAADVGAGQAQVLAEDLDQESSGLDVQLRPSRSRRARCARPPGPPSPVRYGTAVVGDGSTKPCERRVGHGSGRTRRRVAWRRVGSADGPTRDVAPASRCSARWVSLGAARGGSSARPQDVAARRAVQEVGRERLLVAVARMTAVPLRRRATRLAVIDRGRSPRTRIVASPAASRLRTQRGVAVGMADVRRDRQA